MSQEQWYHTVALQEYALETLQEEYCYQYYKVFNKFPLPSVMERDKLISEIKRLEQTALNEMQSSVASL
tara:strand:- start:151 stop:357 length:207 start_codon:yes stop_codon:yes gene_type:complete